MVRRIAGIPAWILWAALALLAAIVAGALWVAAVWTRSAEPDASRVEVSIPRGAGLGQAARLLAAAGVVEHARTFELAARFIGDDRPIQYGLYAFRRGAGWGETLDRMQRGDVILLRILIPEGMPSILVAEQLMRQERLTGEVEAPAEGSVLPATYVARPGEERAAVLARMQAEMTQTLENLWAERSADTVVRTPEEAIILASIVEKETAQADERRRIAGLYTNRLRRGMRLEADPTVIYPVTKGKPLGRRIRRSELAADNGYNTYLRAGLPDGPITNPGRESIAAVLDPEEHDYLFMVADGGGGHAFARSFAEHQANVAKWYAIRRERGEM